MKQVFLLTIAVVSSLAGFSQSEKYESAMKANIARLDSMTMKNNQLEVANNFTRIGDAEKNQWLPYYYAAYALAKKGITDSKANRDELADKATELLNKSSAILGKENSEIDVVRSMIATAHLLVDPQSTYMTYGPESSDWLKKAIALDSTNPRPYLVTAEGVFNTPESFGGGKDAAKPLFDKAAQLFSTFKPATALSPDWGKAELEYFMQNYK